MEIMKFILNLLPDYITLKFMTAGKNMIVKQQCHNTSFTTIQFSS